MVNVYLMDPQYSKKIYIFWEVDRGVEVPFEIKK